jgi:hypothetical protein
LALSWESVFSKEAAEVVSLRRKGQRETMFGRECFSSY